MIGLTILAVIAVYIGVFAYVVVHARNRAEKIAAIAVALAIPFWDLPFGYFNFYRHCSQEGGVHVGVNIPPATSILVDSSSRYTPNEILRFGFKVVEYEAPGEIVRYTRESKGLTKSIHATPMSNIKIKFAGHKNLPWNLIRSDYVVTRLDNEQIVASQTDFQWRGMWWQVSAAPLLGYGSQCLGEKDKPMLALMARPS
jgi:hypothetical protein